MQFEDDSYEIIGLAMEVHNEFGPGLREKPYENALVIALKAKGFRVDQQRPYPIHFRGTVVGECKPDLTENNNILIDAKSIEKVTENEISQMLNYLRISEIETGLVINFKNSKLDWKRVVLEQKPVT